MSSSNLPPAPGSQPPLPGGQPYVPVPPPKKSFFARHKVLTVLGALVVVVIIIVIATSTGGSKPPAASGTTTPAGQVTQDATAGGAADATQQADQTQVAEPTAPAEPTEAPAPPAGGDAVAIGTPVTDGPFEFTVTSVTPGVASVGSGPLTQQAQGQYVQVELSVKNVGNEAKYFTDTNQLLIDTEGRQHSADSTAAIYAGNNDSLLSKINPGNSVGGLLFFDIPADATPAFIELHADMFSDGVRVAVP